MHDILHLPGLIPYVCDMVEHNYVVELGQIERETPLRTQGGNQANNSWAFLPSFVMFAFAAARLRSENPLDRISIAVWHFQP